MKRYALAGLLSVLLILLMSYTSSSHAAITALDGFNPNVDGPVYTTAVQSDGRILIGGLFTNVGGFARSNIARLNADGSVDTGFSPVANGSVETIALQSDGAILIGGGFTSIGVTTRNHMAKLDSSGNLVAAFDPNANGYVYTIAVQPSDNKILIGGAFTTVGGASHNHLARLETTGSPDSTFSSVNGHTDGDVYTIAVQADGSIMVGGAFACAGSASCVTAGAAVSALTVSPASNSSTDRRRTNKSASSIQTLGSGAGTLAAILKGIARLDSTGTLDASSFTAAQLGDIAGAVYSIVVHPDGHVIFGGDFSLTKTAPAVTITNLARTTFNGVLDTSFNPAPNNWVTALAVQADGNILAGGWFTCLGVSCAPNDRRLARIINSTGAVDAGFTPTVDGTVYAIAAQPDGKAVFGGSFTNVSGKTQVNGNPLNNVARLYSNGVLETEFNLNGIVDGEVYAVAVQSGGRVVVGGQFTSVAGALRTNLARFNGDGSLDSGFTVTASGPVYSLEIDGNQNILIGGAFTTIGGQTRNRLARWDETNGVIDSFNPNVNGTVYAIKVQSDGKVLLGGLFTTVNGSARNNIARLATTGLPDAFNPNVVGPVRAIALQSNGKIVIGGSFTFVSGTQRNRIARLESDGLLDSGFDAGVVGTVIYALAIQSDRSILLGGSFSSVLSTTRNNLARISVSLADDSISLDALNPDIYNLSGASVASIAIQTNGRIVIGGNFTKVGGSAGTGFNNVARLLSDGSPDASFNPGANAKVNAVAMSGNNIALGGSFTVVAGAARPFAAMVGSTGLILGMNNPGNGEIRAIAFQPDGKMLVGGTFTNIGGQSRNLIARFNADGTVDGGFTPTIAGTSVNAIAVQSDGKILVGGEITGLLVRLDTGGSVDGAFSHSVVGTSVNAIAVQTDGKILVGGEITGLLMRLDTGGSADGTFSHSVAGTSVNAIAVQTDGKILVGGTITNLLVRLTAGGSTDAFSPGLGGTSVNAITVQPDQKILVGGLFTDSTYSNLVRLSSTATIDMGFAAVNPNGLVNSIGLATDGSLVIGGAFTQADSASRPYIARLTGAGVLDSEFNPAPDNSVTALGIQPDGKVVIGGSFFGVSGAPRYGLAKINYSLAGGGSLDVPDNTTVTWNRLGMLPEVSRVVFETSDNGSSWTTIVAAAVRGTNNWTGTGLALEQNKAYYLRARGYVSGGEDGGEGSVIEIGRLVYLPTKPVVTTDAVTLVNPYFAELKGTVSGSQNATIEFDYGTNVSYGTTVAALQSPLVSGVGTVSHFLVDATTTRPITYHYRVRAANNHYMVLGLDQSVVLNAVGTEKLVSSADIPKGIPDNSAAGVTSDLTIANGECPTITGVSLYVNAQHPSMPELSFQLSHGDKSANFSNYSGASSAFNGVFSSLNATDAAAGLWQLKVVDGAAGNAGTVEDWGIVLNCIATLDVSTTGNGTVTSVPAGISCGATCSATFSLATSVTLTASATGNWDLDVWTGACPSQYPTLQPCVPSMIENKAVGATFVEIADFALPAAPVYAGFTAFFTDLSKHDPASWSWDFGDGTAASTLQDPGHVFPTAGSFTVKLNVNGAASRFERTKPITVETCTASDPALPVKLGEIFYATVAEAYASAGPVDTIVMLEGVIMMGTGTGGTIAIDKDILLDGGYFCGFVPNPDAASAVYINADAVDVTTGVLTIQ